MSSEGDVTNFFFSSVSKRDDAALLNVFLIFFYKTASLLVQLATTIRCGSEE